MPERGYQAQLVEQRNRFASPDSVMLTMDSNFSLFSSASASVDRCSLASDDISLRQLGVPEGGNNSDNNSQESNCWSGPDHNSHSNKSNVKPNLNTRFRKNHPRPSTKGDKTKALKEAKHSNRGEASTSSSSTTTTTTNTNTNTTTASSTEDHTRNSFSLALKECQERRSRSEAASLRIKPDRRRPASLDLNNVAAAIAPSSSSPGFGSSMKKGGGSVVSRTSSGNFQSPNNHHQRAMTATNKGWPSERVPPPSSTTNNNNNGINGRRQSHGYVPLSGNNNTRALPSKWEDAERWIFSPVNNPVSGPTTGPSGTKKPKSKSGPLGPPGFAYYSLYSPVGGGSLPVYEAGSNAGFVSGASPFSARVIAAGGGGAGGNGVGSNGHHHHHHQQQHVAYPARNEPCMARSVSIHGCSEMVALQSFNSTQDEKLDGFKDAATDISRAISRRDMATQMSPEGSVHSSPSGRLSFSDVTPSALPIMKLELQSIHSSKADVRDVQVDERVTVTRWSKRHKGGNRKKSSEIVDDWGKKTRDSRSSAWDVSETTKSISKATREEAKINAWENLQKAKAEAAIRKLEMKLEKKRSSSMDKIMNKLRSAQKKAQEMRSAVIASQAHQVSRTSRKAMSFRRTRQMGSLSGCFTCQAF